MNSQALKDLLTEKNAIIKELEEKLAVAVKDRDGLSVKYDWCNKEMLKMENKLSLAIEALEKIAGEYYCRETGRYIDDAIKALEKIKG